MQVLVQLAGFDISCYVLRITVRARALFRQSLRGRAAGRAMTSLLRIVVMCGVCLLRMRRYWGIAVECVGGKERDVIHLVKVRRCVGLVKD